MLADSERDGSGKLLGVRDTSETRPRHFRDTSETRPRHVRDTSETPPRHFRDTSHTQEPPCRRRRSADAGEGSDEDESGRDGPSAFAVASWDGSAHIYHISKEGTFSLACRIGRSDRVYCVSLSVSGGLVAVGGRDSAIGLYDIRPDRRPPSRGGLAGLREPSLSDSFSPSAGCAPPGGAPRGAGGAGRGSSLGADELEPLWLAQCNEFVCALHALAYGFGYCGGRVSYAFVCPQVRVHPLARGDRAALLRSRRAGQAADCA